MSQLLSAYRPHERVQVFFPEESLTQQSAADETNINKIMARYERTGLIDHLNKHQGHYGDFIAFKDYHTSLNLILSAGEAFMELPAGVRARFKNDPADFLAFAQDPNNLTEMIEMGLAPKQRPQELPQAVKDPPKEPPLPLEDKPAKPSS